MRIATYNVNGINARLPVLLRWLQELKAPQQNFPASAIAQAGYGALWQGQKSWNGEAILARGHQPLERRMACPATMKTTRAATWKPR